MTCSIVTTDRQLTAVVAMASPFAEIPSSQRTARATLAAALPSLDVGTHGRTCTRWTPPANGVLPLEMGLIVTKAFAAQGEVVCSELPAGRAVHYAMEGGFEKLPGAWDTLFKWLSEQKLTAAGVNWEIYGVPSGADLYALLA
jgi:hypothetical protein